MPYTLFSQIRRRRYRPVFCGGFAMLMLAWLSLSFAAICNRPMAKHASQQAASCPFEMLADEVNGQAPSSPDDCAFKICPDQPSERWLWNDHGKDPTPMPFVLDFASIVFFVIFGTARSVHRLDLRPARRAAVPLIYQFCSLLN